MSFSECKEVISAGDTVILYLGQEHLLSQVVTRDHTYQTRHGALRHNDMIGRRFGSRVKTGKGFVHVLRATPELWTQCLPHRTQILYTTDISLIIYQLDVRPGSIVCEAGTGSGSMSHAMIRTVKPSGHLHTYEFHEERMTTAEREFKEHGLADYVTVECRDVCKDGFPLEEGSADAIFLDLPNPWLAIPSAHRTLKQMGRLCSFSPCIEQVSKVVDVMRDVGLTDIVTSECLSRQYDVKLITLPVPQLTSTRPPPATDRQQGDINMTSNSNTDTSSADVNLTSDVCTTSDNSCDVSLTENDNTSCDVNVTSSQHGARQRDITLHACASPVEQPGHTGYLTFATRMRIEIT